MPKETIKRSIQQDFREAFSRVYPVDGDDPAERYKRDSDNPDAWDELTDRYDDADWKEEYIYHPLSLMSSFLGLPNKSRGKKQSWKNLALDFVGWNKGDRWYTRLFFKVISPLTALLNLVLLPLRLVLNIVRLATEFLPALLIVSLQSWITQLQEKLSRDPVRCHSIPRYRAAYYFWVSLVYVFALFGRAITSPGFAVRMAWYDGEKLGQFLGLSLDYNILTRAILAGLSITITTAAYTLLLPLAIKFLALTVLPNLPGVLVTSMGVLAKGFAAIGQIGILFCAKLTGLSFAVGTMPELAGIGFLAGLVFSGAGAIADKIYRYFNSENENYCPIEENHGLSPPIPALQKETILALALPKWHSPEPGFFKPERAPAPVPAPELNCLGFSFSDSDT